jgi:hypothetical protein
MTIDVSSRRRFSLKANRQVMPEPKDGLDTQMLAGT